MSDQSRGPAQEPEPGRSGRAREPGAGSHEQASPAAPERDGAAEQAPQNSPESGNPNEPLHPWQTGTTAGARGVPADPAARPRPEQSQPADTPRLTPRPIQRPQVAPEQSSVFGRPHDVEGSFDPPQSGGQPQSVENAQPPPEALATAFGRPADSDEILQRAPGEQPAGAGPGPERPFWNTRGYREPWRDPSADAVLGPPAVPETERQAPAELQPGPLLSAREVLFGRRVRPRSLLALAVVAVVLGVLGGFVGRITAEEGNPLTNPNVTLAKPEPGTHRPAGTVAGVAKRVVPAVVSVETHVGAQGGTGSGVVIDGNGYILTNNHVVSMAADTPNAQVSTVFQGGKRVPARIVGRDAKTDLAVIKVEVANPTVAQLGSSSDLAVGDDVVAIGSPLQLAGTVTTGIVSSVHRPVRLSGEGSDTNAVIDAVQTDAAINPGNSGGALVDGNGSVVGINSAIRSLGSGGAGGSIGLGFAIPIDNARRIAQELIRTGHAQHADLGVNAKSVSDGRTDGAQVQNVRDGSAAAAAGIAEGDVITRIGDREVSTADELIVAVNSRQNGEGIPITVVRQGRQLVLDARLS